MLLERETGSYVSSAPQLEATGKQGEHGAGLRQEGQLGEQPLGTASMGDGGGASAWTEDTSLAGAWGTLLL